MSALAWILRVLQDGRSEWRRIRALGARSDRVSRAWLDAQERWECADGYQGVCWSWPVRKARDENAADNRRRLRAMR